jgi:L-fucose isomerase
VRFDEATDERLSRVATPQWPVAFTRLEVDADCFISRFPCNHIHGVYGDYVSQLIAVADILGIEYEIYR